MEKGVVFGLKCGELLASYDQDGFLLKMSQISLLKEEQEFFTTLPKSGMMRNGKLYQQKMLEQNTLESEYGLLPTQKMYPTACARDFRENYTALRSRIGTQWEKNGLPRVIYRDMIMKYPTPCAGNWKDSIGTLKGRVGTKHEEGTIARVLFKDEVLSFPTPRAADIEGGVASNVKLKNGRFSRTNKKGQRWGVKLRDALLNYPNLNKEEQSSVLREKIEQMENLESKPLKGLKMNPDWIEWLMGYPKKWTDITIELKELGMQSYRKSHIK